MGKKKKTNPNKIPCSQADVDRAGIEGEERGKDIMASVIFMTLLDKMGWTPDGADLCPYCESRWARIAEDGSIEHVETNFCPVCGASRDSFDYHSLTKLWSQIEKTVEELNERRILYRNVQEVLCEYDVQNVPDE